MPKKASATRVALLPPSRWAIPANDAGHAAPTPKVVKRKVCRKQVKAELRAVKGSRLPRDKLRRDWITNRCWACMRCPELLAKLRMPSRKAP